MVRDSCCPSFEKTVCFLENYRFVSLPGKNHQFLIRLLQMFLGNMLNKTFILWMSIFVIFAYVPLWYEDHVFVSRKGISGYHFRLDGSYDGLRTVQVVVD